MTIGKRNGVEVEPDTDACLFEAGLTRECADIFQVPSISFAGAKVARKMSCHTPAEHLLGTAIHALCRNEPIKFFVQRLIVAIKERAVPGFLRIYGERS